uniref:Bifunctional polynucleotide phosphatase/kinase n=1 Tax=Rhabditophanes sp. KR3021 TaxID=114890 RepID=A0AC35U940_9BILA
MVKYANDLAAAVPDSSEAFTKFIALFNHDLKRIGAKATKYWMTFSGTNLSKILEHLYKLFDGVIKSTKMQGFYKALRDIKRHARSEILSEEEKIQAIQPCCASNMTELSVDIPFDPVTYLHKNLPEFIPCNTVLNKNKQEMVILVGLPASGKSTLAKKWENKYNYGVINRDTLNTQVKCLTIANQMIEEGRSVVIDNTNMNAVSREKYIDLAKTHKISIRCFHFNLTPEHCIHNNAFRQRIGTDRAHDRVDKNVIWRLQRTYEKPELDEGFESIVTVNFVPIFENGEHARIYNSRLVN